MSEHPLATQATGEVVGMILDQLGPGPAVVLVFVTTPHLGALDDIAATIRSTLAPGVILGATAASVSGGSREVEHEPAVAVWAASGPTARPLRLAWAASGGTGLEAGTIHGWPEATPGPGSTLALLAHPLGFPAAQALDEASRRLPGTAVVGGLASAITGPGGNRLALDGAVHTDGAVGVLFGPEWQVVPAVSHGGRPIGPCYTVTSAERSMVRELAGRPATERLGEVLGGLTPEDRAAAAGGLLLGRVVDPHAIDPGPGDFLVRAVRGADHDAGAVAVDDVVAPGDTVQFHVRGAASADEGLRDLLGGGSAAGALVFTGSSRGSRMFDRADHDADLLAGWAARSGMAAVAGPFCDLVFGPVGPGSFVHGPETLVTLLAGER